MIKTISASDLNIDLSKPDDCALFKWLLASFLMGKRIQASIAIDAYRVIVEKHQRDTSRKLAGCTHRDLVRMLGEARYTRYDESTAMRLVKLAKKLNEEYAGRVSGIRDASIDSAEFRTRLQVFEGIGPKTVEIFMRDAQQVLFFDARLPEAGSGSASLDIKMDTPQRGPCIERWRIRRPHLFIVIGSKPMKSRLVR